MRVLISEKLSEHKYKTPEGYLICTDAILARTGKQTYTRDELFGDGDNTEVNVDRPYDEVMNEKTIASFENKPVTFDHPEEDVNIGNYKSYAVGYVRDVRQGKVDGKDVILGNLVITDEDAINAIESGDHTDLSCGYDCDIKDDGNGNYAQNNIRGNHVALCREGRAGIARIVDSKVKDGNYIYEFYYNDIDNEDRRMMRKYNLEVVGKSGKSRGERNLAVKGSLENLKRYAKDYLGYELHPNYLIPESQFTYDMYDSVKDSKMRDEFSGIRNGITYWYDNGEYFIRHKNGKVERIDGDTFEKVDDLYKYIDNIRDSKVKDWIPEEVRQFKVERRGRGYGVYYKGQLVSKYDDYDEYEAQEELKRLRRYYYVDSKIKDNNLLETIDRLQASSGVRNYTMKEGKNKNNGHHIVQYIFDRNNLIVYDKNRDEIIGLIENGKTKINKLHDAIIDSEIIDSKMQDASYTLTRKWDDKVEFARIAKKYNLKTYGNDTIEGKPDNIEEFIHDYCKERFDKDRLRDSKIKDDLQYDDYSTKEIEEAAKKLLKQKPFLSYEEALQKVKENIKNGNYLLDNEIKDSKKMTMSNAIKMLNIVNAYKKVKDADIDTWVIKNTGLAYEVWNNGKMVKKFPTKKLAVEWIRGRFPTDKITEA